MYNEKLCANMYWYQWIVYNTLIWVRHDTAFPVFMTVFLSCASQSTQYTCILFCSMVFFFTVFLFIENKYASRLSGNPRHNFLFFFFSCKDFCKTCILFEFSLFLCAYERPQSCIAFHFVLFNGNFA